MSGTFVDSSVLLDIFTLDKTWLEWSETQLRQAAGRGALLVNALVLAEISPRFSQVEDLRSAIADFDVEAIPDSASYLAGNAHAKYRRSGGRRRAVLPDFLIGAHAAVTSRPLLTRDPRRVASYIPGAVLICP